MTGECDSCPPISRLGLNTLATDMNVGHILLSTKYTGFLDASYGSLFDLEISMPISDDNLDSELILLFRSDASVSYVKTREVILTEQ